MRLPWGRILIRCGLGRPWSDPASFLNSDIARVSGRVKGGMHGTTPRRPVSPAIEEPHAVRGLSPPPAQAARHLRDPRHVRFRPLRQLAQAAQLEHLAAGPEGRRTSTASRSTAASSTSWPGSGYRANAFISGLAQFMPRELFGGMKDRDLVDALILQHEADRLGIPARPEMGREWLKQITGGRMNRELFETLFSRFSNEVSGEQILADLANQVRLPECPPPAGLAGRHAPRRLPDLPRPERADRRQARRGPRRVVPRPRSPSRRRPTSRPSTTSTRTSSPTPPATPPASRSRARSRSRSSRSTATPWPAASRTS